MINSAWGAFWAIVILCIAFWQGMAKGLSLDATKEEGCVAFIIIAAIAGIQLAIWLYFTGASAP